MITTLTKQRLSTRLSFLLLITAVQLAAGGQQSAPTGSSGYSGQGAPLSADELQQLVAPIALYPDALVAQILGAATFPDQVAAASSWLQQNKNLTGTALMQAVDAQPWDPSVKALTQFPSVLDNLARNLSWTSALGEAYHTQAADVMSAVQVLRAKAYAAGNLKSGSQITVVQQSPQVIVIQPANPQVVYVPQYNPAVVYGTPYVTPGYSSADVVATGLISFGVGMAVGAAISGGGCCGWGYSYWNCNWHGGAVVYQSNVYYGNNAWHGGYYGSSATAYGPYGAARVGPGVQPPHRSVWRDGADLQCLWELRKLGCLEERPDGVHPASDYRARVCGNGTDLTGGQGRCRDGRVRQQLWRGANRQRQQICCGPNGQWQPICSLKRQLLQEHWQRLAANPGKLVTGMGTAAKEHRVIGLWWRRMAIQGGECSWFV